MLQTCNPDELLIFSFIIKTEKPQNPKPSRERKPKSLRVGKKDIMKKAITLTILLNMTFFVNAQLLNNSGTFPVDKSVTHLSTNEKIIGKQINSLTEIQKATTHVNFSTEIAKLYSSFVSKSKTPETKANFSTQPLLDSIVTKNVSGINSQKEVYFYDTNGNDTTYLVYSWDNVHSKWSISSKQKYVKDNNGLILSFESYTWIAGIYFMGSTKYENTYNSDKEVLTKTVYQWDILSSNWKYSTKSENAYDVNKNLISTIDYSRDNNLNVWNESTKTEFYYDVNNILITEINSNRDILTPNWINVTKDEHKVNSIGKDTLVLEYNWDNNSSIWSISSKTRYLYDSNNNLTGFENWDWNSDTGTWVGVAKLELVLNSNKMLLSSVTYMWDSGTSTWKGFAKTTVSYYPNNLEQFMITYKPNGNSWLENTESESIYDGNNNKTIENSYNWNLVTSSWDKIQVSNYYYSLNSTFNPFLIQTEIAVYPNPVSNELQITGLIANSDIVILDMSGKIVYSQKYSGKTIDVSTLTNGIYFLQITNISGRANYKFIKVHTK